MVNFIFEVKLRYDVHNSKGQVRRKTSAILFSAANFTDAEAQGYKYAEENSLNSAIVIGIRRSRVKKSILFDKSNQFFNVKARTLYITDDGAEKYITDIIIVEAESSTAAINKTSIAIDNCEVVSVSKSRLLDIMF